MNRDGDRLAISAKPLEPQGRWPGSSLALAPSSYKKWRVNPDQVRLLRAEIARKLGFVTVPKSRRSNSSFRLIGKRRRLRLSLLLQANNDPRVFVHELCDAAIPTTKQH